MTGRMLAVVALLLMGPAVGAQEAPRADGWVVLPIDEYRTLRARAFPSPPEPAPPPVDATLTRVDYDLRVTGDTAAGQARLSIDVLKQGWVSVQIPAGLLVRDARIDGRPTALVDGNPPRVLLARAGRATLTLDIVVPLSSSAGVESAALPPSGSALTAATLVIPRTGVDLSVASGFIADRTETATETRWVAYGSAGRPLTFSWKRKADDRRSTLPLKTRAHVVELVALGEDSTQVTASVHVEVTQGLARSAVLSIPPGLVVNQVAGPAVADWNAAGDALTVTFLEPIAADTSLVVSGETRAPREGSVTVPIVRVPAAERETGGLAVDVAGAGELGERQPRGLEPADPSDLGDIISGRESPSMAAFRYTPQSGTAPRTLTVNVSRYTPQAVLVANVEEARYDALIGEDGKTLVRARYAVRNNQRSFLAVTLPAQSALWTASLAGRQVRPGVSADGGLLLPLQKGRAGEEAPTFAVELVYLQRTPAWNEKGDTHLELPALDLPVSRTGVSLHHSPRYAIDPKPGAFRVETDPGPWSAALRQIEEIDAAAAVVAGPPPPPPPAQAERTAGDKDGKSLQMLVDQYKKEAGRTRQGAVPVAVTFPEVGPSVFLAAELTAETHAPSLDLAYHKTGGR
jgi:hypothetical protein